MVIEVEERPAEDCWFLRNPGGQSFANRSRGLREILVLLAVPEAPRDATDAGVHGHDRLIGGKQEHSICTRLAHLRDAFQCPARRPDRSSNGFCQIWRPPESIDAGPQRLDALLEIRACEGDAVLELLLRRPPHRVRRQRADSLQRRQRHVALAWRGMHGQDFPHEQCEGIARRGWKPAVKRPQSIDERFNVHRADGAHGRGHDATL